MLRIQTSRSVSTYIWSSLDPYFGISSIQWAKLAKPMAPVARDSQPRPKTQKCALQNNRKKVLSVTKSVST